MHRCSLVTGKTSESIGLTIEQSRVSTLTYHVYTKDIYVHFIIHVRMVLRITSLHENEHLQTIFGTVAVLTVFVAFTEITLRTVAPLVIMFSGITIHDVIDESYDLPKGTNWLFYGASVFAAGTYLMISNLTSFGSLLALCGLWFVFDGITKIRYEPSQTTHEYVSDLDSEMTETMLRMQTLNGVYQTLRASAKPQTVAEIATDRELTESRVKSALRYLESKGRVVQEENRYHAAPPRFGRLEPVVQFLVWIPRRVLRPFRRIVVNV